MECFAAIDVSLELSSVCVVDATGRIVCAAEVASEPEALVRLFREGGLTYTRIGLEAGPLLQWLHAGLTAAGFEVVLLETRRVKAVLGAMTMKMDRNDARGMARMIRMGWFRPVHAKTSRRRRCGLCGQKARAVHKRCRGSASPSTPMPGRDGCGTSSVAARRLSIVWSGTRSGNPSRATLRKLASCGAALPASSRPGAAGGERGGVGLGSA